MTDVERPEPPAKAKMRGGVIKRGATWSYVIRERVEVVDVDGRPVLDEAGSPRMTSKPRWVGGYRTRKEAEAARADARSAQGRGTYVAPSKVTVGQWLDTWLEGHTLELKRSTAESYRVTIDRYLRPHIGAELVQQLSPARLTVVFRRLHETGGRRGEGLSARTVEYCRAILRRALNDAVLEHVIAVNPVVGTKRPRPVKAKHTTWTAAQAATYLDAPTGAPDRLPDGAETAAVAAHKVAVSARFARGRLAGVVALALATGMRRGEILALRWQDVDLDAGVVRVERAVTVLAGARTYDTPKNHERRAVRIDADAVDRLRARRKAQTKDRLAWGPAWEDTDGLVFTHENGAPLRPDWTTKTFHRAQTDLAVPPITFHELRHTHATLLLRDRVPVHVVSKRLGHKDPSITLNVYADVIPQDDGEAADVFGRLLRGARGAS